jgi:hypothetical protein
MQDGDDPLLGRGDAQHHPQRMQHIGRAGLVHLAGMSLGRNGDRALERAHRPYRRDIRGGPDSVCFILVI